MSILSDHERFKNLASSFQSLTIALGVLVGGLWALFTFGVLGQVERAKSELALLGLESKRKAAEIQALEESLKRQAVLNISIESSRLPSAAGGSAAWVVTVTIENAGSRTAVLDLSEPSLHITSVEVGQSLELRYGATTRFRPASPSVAPAVTQFTATVVRTANKKLLRYLVRPPVNSLYVVAFAVPLSDEEITSARQADQQLQKIASKRVLWEATAFLDARDQNGAV